MKKALLLNSGGLDTLITAKILKDQGWELYSLYIYLGQLNHENASKSAKRIADNYCVSHDAISVSGTPYLTHKTETDLEYLHVPFQAFVVLSLGMMYAGNKEINYMATGLKNDFADKKYFESLTDMMSVNSLNKSIILIRPVANLLEIKDVYDKGIELGLSKKEMEFTVSCQDDATPCGKCVKCKQRLELGL